MCFFSRPLVDLIKGRNVRVQVKAANALEAMATNNFKCQKAFLELDAPKVLIKLLKVNLIKKFQLFQLIAKYNI